MPPASRLAHLTPDHIARLAEREDVVVYEPVHDTLFEPWPAAKVRACVSLVVGVARKCESAEAAKERLRGMGGDVADFAAKYQLMFDRLADPDIARNEAHVQIVLSMIEMRARVESGAETEASAQRQVGEQAMAGLLAQAQAAAARED